MCQPIKGVVAHVGTVHCTIVREAVFINVIYFNRVPILEKLDKPFLTKIKVLIPNFIVDSLDVIVECTSARCMEFTLLTAIPEHKR
jgi:hypothetical protein